ncbi:DNA-3-methyladenine glycosylase 1 [Methanimicrococcus sp. At1]|uniref:DNA-3-methyladenine glycosylase 1 n=1 Tax=Methanimicrococcus hacksteinii TaxID=3028293 RepID=A0ABU3VR67_9EURY|nr:DNA-3-methyladenine glycosylase I [Methanimicrococcus sp. At1]MDV0445794.1 DNA-3-methyladenine glycosylase 1 [Methanimicrococcus sp. At1]
MAEEKRCGWSKTPTDHKYHDEEWGKPLHDERRLFEMLILEGQQAGLSWSIILKKREAMREAYDGFDPEIMKDYDEKKTAELLLNEGIIRNRLKIKAAVTNANAYFKLKEEYGSLDAFMWRYVGGEPILNHPKTMSEIPASTELSDQISKDLKKLGFSFVGSTIIYAYMQAIGMVNDHLKECDFR